MGKKKKGLSHAEVWDDSALLQSWDDALAEYKLYHSIHARGERVEDVIKDMQAGDEDIVVDNVQSVDEASHLEVKATPSEDGELEEEFNSIGNGNLSTNIKNNEGQDLLFSPSATSVEHQQKPPVMPDAIINGVGDEGLKNLMMSWYYAGYYTGLYEGQQQKPEIVPK